MNLLELRGAVIATTPGLLALSGAVNTHTTTATINYAIDGVLRQKTSITGGTTPTTDANTGLAFPALTTSKGTVVVWGLNAAGSVRLAQGTIESLDAGNAFVRAPQFPAIPTDFVPFAYSVLKLSSAGTTVTVGTSNWNATGFTNSTKDVAYLPSRPVVS